MSFCLKKISIKMLINCIYSLHLSPIFTKKSLFNNNKLPTSAQKGDKTGQGYYLHKK